MVGAPVSFTGNQAQHFGATGNVQENSESSAKYAQPPALYATPNATISTLLPYNGLAPSAAPPHQTAPAYPASSLPNPAPGAAPSLEFCPNPSVPSPYNTCPPNPAAHLHYFTYPPNPGPNPSSVYPPPQPSAPYPPLPVPPAPAPYSQTPAYPPQSAPSAPAHNYSQFSSYPPLQHQTSPPAGYPPYPPPGAPTGYPSGIIAISTC